VYSPIYKRPFESRPRELPAHVHSKIESLLELQKEPIKNQQENLKCSRSKESTRTMSVSTQQASKAAVGDSNTAPQTTNNTANNESPQASQVAMETPIPNILSDTDFHTLFANLLERVEQIATEVSNIKQKPGEDVTTDVISHIEAEQLSMEENTDPLVGEPVTRSEEQRLRSLYSKFTPSKITPRYAEQSIDQLESWLDINEIYNDHERFLLLKMSIEPETYKQVSTALTTKHPGKEYESLKKAIIQAFTDSEEKQLQNLLSGVKLGDRRPSQLLAEMSSLYKGPKDKIFEKLFLNHLPVNVRGILVSMTSKDNKPQNIETIAQWADSIMEQFTAPSTNNAISDNWQITALESKLDNVYQKIDAFTNNNNSRLKPSFRSRSFLRNNNNRPEKENDDPICYFHRKFGNNKHDNRKCLSSCQLHKQWLTLREKMQKN
jgi:hypothetical protein